jgi:nucleotide-binding universal stress UspA family protein
LLDELRDPRPNSRVVVDHRGRRLGCSEQVGNGRIENALLGLGVRHELSRQKRTASLAVEGRASIGGVSHRDCGFPANPIGGAPDAKGFRIRHHLCMASAIGPQTASTPAPSAPASSASGIFDRVVCGIDESPSSLEAVRQARSVLAPGGRLHLVAVAETGLAVRGGWAASSLDKGVEARARAALERASAHAGGGTSQLVEGDPVSALLDEIERAQATLAVLGSHGGNYVAGLLLGETTTVLLHTAPCSVLLARAPGRLGDGFPQSIVVGVDGSSPSRRALDIGRELSDRLGVPLRALAASGGKPVRWEGLREIEDLQWTEQGPVPGLVEASAGADLLVVGSRGLHGLAALGSVGERLAHRAHCSVLVVRE